MNTQASRVFRCPDPECESCRPFRNDPVSNPPHYTDHPSGVECIQVTEHMGFCTGNAIKYIWRAGLKGDTVTDLKKAIWYLEREVARLQKEDK